MHEIEIHRLHPTQITVGMIEVRDKCAVLSRLRGEAQRDFLKAHPIPAVEGPEDRLYITDHHHLGRALHDERVERAFFNVEADLSVLSPEAFWAELDRRLWVHPVDETGRRLGFDDIPKHLEELRDDPYRSLAGYVRNAGGYQKTTQAYAEFLWADFFRVRIPISAGDAGFRAAVLTATTLAHGEEARLLPGWYAAAT